MTEPRRGILAASLIALALSLTGYGGDEAATTPTPPEPTPVATATESAAPSAPTRTPAPFHPPLPPTFTPSPVEIVYNVCFAATARRDPPHPDCPIKGTITPGGEKVFYVPGDQVYAAVDVDPAEGERWFHGAAEAIDAGWTWVRDREVEPRS